MRGKCLLAGMLLMGVLGGAFAPGGPGGGLPASHAAAPVTIEVTNAGDPDTAVCPHAADCTLRKAIEAVNAEGPESAYAITFKASVFPADSPATIAVTGDPLPEVTKDAVTIDATGRGVWLDGAELGADDPFDGLVLAGANATVRGLAIHNFSGRCLVLKGATSVAGGSAAGQGNRIGGCATGIVIGGAESKAEGNRIGFAVNADDPATVETGILVTARDVTIGGATAAHGNVIGNAGTGIQVGLGTGDDFSGVAVSRNTVGRDPAGSAASVETGIDLRQPGGETSIISNTIANAHTGISVAKTKSSADVTGNTFTDNRFSGLSGMAIDLNADGLRNPNDDGDSDAGGNLLLNHPVVTKATQAKVTGTAGATCAGCEVTLYSAVHTPGSPNDYGATPISGGTRTTDGSGNFEFDGLGVSPGQWIIGIVTDADGNTSEFGPSARVGAGVVQCANLPLVRGWNHKGYFGSGTLTLGDTYPAGTGKVSAIHHLTDGSSAFTSWFANTTSGRTLYTLTPGEAYWFYATEPVTTGGGFTLTVPVPVALKAGWNEFVYIGATADVRDALSNVGGQYTSVYRFENDGEVARWLPWGDEATPDYVRGFANMEACGVYAVRVEEDATFTPLQP